MYRAWSEGGGNSGDIRKACQYNLLVRRIRAGLTCHARVREMICEGCVFDGDEKSSAIFKRLGQAGDPTVTVNCNPDVPPAMLP